MSAMKPMRDYLYHIGLALRIYPSDKQKHIIRINGGASRYIYNKLVGYHREAWQLKKTSYLSPADKARLEYLSSVLESKVSLEAMIPFLKMDEIDSAMVDHAIKHYNTAWNNYKKVKGTKIPTFHKKDNSYSYCTSNHYSSKRDDGLHDGSVYFIDENHIFLPKLGKIRFKGSKKFVSSILTRVDMTRLGTVTIRMDATDDCYVSLALASDIPFHTAYPQTGKAVGVDMNLTNFLYDSDGNEISSPKFLRKAEAKLKKEQRKLSRKLEAAKRDGRDYRTCKNYQEQRLKVAEIHKHVANQRLDFIRNVANMEVKNHDYMFAEDLKVRNLVKNHKLAQAISDSGWRKFLTEYEWCSSKRGKTCLLVDPKNTTQTCSKCGYVSHGDTRITLGQEEWDCPQCGTHHIRDYNAAVNIKNAGLHALQEASVPISLS